ncbi:MULTISPECIES: hypothetical protein [unclassified Paenarthrobacter]|uniref:hypothetical protein n=1 Tax=unclassified Paenarthrobacter TaxID=2634190 RepID=UPI001F3EA9CF|nr:hypothetical protein [Paenarthrobacter sp. AR 02]MCF3138274.1 hypothetical protein [Paenarthrobacter sp. AR 02]
MQSDVLVNDATPAQKKRHTKLRITLLGAALAVSAVVTPLAIAPANATGGVDYFCASSWGTTVWNGHDPYACSGTLTGYRDGYNVGSVNMVQLIADQPPRTELDLNQWCSDNSFYCTMAAGAFWAFVSGVIGAANS